MTDRKVSNIWQQLEQDEGLRLKPYRDSVGKLTIGVGRNLDDIGISESEARYLLDVDINQATERIIDHLPWAKNLDVVRMGVLQNMAFNLGIAGLLQFKNFLLAMETNNFEGAAEHMLDSKWAEQVGPRAHRLAEQVRTGEWK